MQIHEQQLESIRRIVCKWLLDPSGEATTSMNEIAALLIEPKAAITVVTVLEGDLDQFKAYWNKIVGEVSAGTDQMAKAASSSEEPKEDLLVHLQRAIDRAEHKPEQWAETRQSMGGVCTKLESLLAATEDRWGSFNHKRDAWLAVAAVNALPELMERVRNAEAGERSADARVDQLLERLEITVGNPYDGIATRDATIKALQARVDQLNDLAVAGADSIIATLDSQAARDVLAERRRQVEKEGWSPEHDEEHDAGVLAAGAAAYALNAADQLHPLSQGDGGHAQPACWPWEAEYWKPGIPRRDLVKAGALILAEIERWDRIIARGTAPEPVQEMDEARADVIGQNGNGGEHYDQLPDGLTWEQAPEWATAFGHTKSGLKAWISKAQYQYVVSEYNTGPFKFDDPGSFVRKRSDLIITAYRPASSNLEALSAEQAQEAAWQAEAMDTDGWTDWHGGDCPVPADHSAAVRFRDGQEVNFSVLYGRQGGARQLGWRHAGNGNPWEIVAYKLIPIEPTGREANQF